MVKKLFAVLSVILCTILVLVGCSPNRPNQDGYRFLNLSGSFHAEHNGWVYYSVGLNLYRQNLDIGQSSRVITGFAGFQHSTYSDGWIYFTDISFTDATLRRMRPDGSELMSLGVQVSDGLFAVTGARIFYQNSSNLYMINTDGTGNTNLIMGIAEFVVSQNHVFIARHVEFFFLSEFIRFDLDGDNQTTILTLPSGILDIFAYGDYLYIHSRHFLPSQTPSGLHGDILHRVRWDGLNQEVIFNITAIDFLQLRILDNIRFYDGFIYFRVAIGSLSNERSLNRVRVDGTSHQKLADDFLDDFEVISGRIIYHRLITSPSLEIELWGFSLDGNIHRRIVGNMPGLYLTHFAVDNILFIVLLSL